jgi:hypothetical protein
MATAIRDLSRKRKLRTRTVKTFRGGFAPCFSKKKRLGVPRWSILDRK